MVVMVRRVVGALVVAGIAALFGCGAAETPEETVARRAQAWADSLIAKDLQKAYTYTSPAYRQSATVGAYHARIAGAGNWTGAKVSAVECEQEVCNATVMVEYAVRRLGVGTIRRPMTWRWLETDGEWWLYVDPK